MSSIPPCKQSLSPSTAMRAFLEDLKHQTQMNCIEIQFDNARTKPSLCLSDKESRSGGCHCSSRCGNSVPTRKNNTMPNRLTDSRGGHWKSDATLLDSRNNRDSSKFTSTLRYTTTRSSAYSMSSMVRRPRVASTKEDHMMSRWIPAAETCDTRGPMKPLNVCRSDAALSRTMRTCSFPPSPSRACPPSSKSELPAPLVGSMSEDSTSVLCCSPGISLHHRRGSLQNYMIALDLVRQKNASRDLPVLSKFILSSSPRRLQKRGTCQQLVKSCDLLLPPVRRQSIEDDDFSACRRVLVADSCEYDDTIDNHGLDPQFREHLAMAVVLACSSE